MARDGSGTFDLAEAAFVNGTTIDADAVNSDLSDIAAGLTQSMSKDGQTVPTANQPMGGFHHTNVAAAAAATDYARADQVIASVLDYAVDTGTATAFAIAPSPGITAYAVGQRFAFKAVHANSGVDPTLAVNSLTAGIIYLPDGTSLAAADITLNGLYEVEVASVTTGTPTFHLQSPIAGMVRKGNTQTLTGAKTFSATLAMSGAALNEAVRVDVASATTCDIGAAASNYVRITGTTTITGLGTVASGVRRHVVFGGALTLTYDATALILPTAATITTVAGDTALFLSEGAGNWRCLSYQRANGRPLTTVVFSVAPFISADTAFTNGSAVTFAHGLATARLLVQLMLVCQSNDSGYTAGQVILRNSGEDTVNIGLTATIDATNIVLNVGSTGLGLVDPSGGFGTATLDATKWKLRVVAFAY